MMMKRRDFLKLSAAGLGTLMLPFPAWSRERHANRMAAVAEDPHFFLQIYAFGGMDSLFLFDGRTQAMTGAGLIHDYVREEPRPWVEGEHAPKNLSTSIARKLEKHRERFSVLNGVFMTPSFDGHEQNVNFFYTGDAFGGESFVAHVNERENESYQKRPLDAILSTSFSFDQTNGGNSVPLQGDSPYNLIQSLRASRPIDPRHPVMTQIASRFGVLGQGRGRFSLGSRAMENGYANTPDLAERLKRVQLTPPDRSPGKEAAFIELMGAFFREGICSSALLQIFPKNHHLDVHAGSTARHQAEIYTGLIENLVQVFDLLAATPFDSKRSLFDVTTVVFGSEFGRTLRQPSLPLNITGTDHNGLNNSILIGGKKIRGGQVIGESDWRQAGEKLSGAHRFLDPSGIKLIGKPFDFNTGRPRTDLPEAYNAENYLTMASVVNTVYSCLSVPQKKWRTVVRDGPKAPVIRSLLT